MAAQRTLLLALAALLPALATSVAGAEEQGGTSVCRADAQKFCSGAGNKMECMIDHQNDLSDACYDFLKQKLKKERREKESRDKEKRDQGSYEPAPAAPSAPIYKVKTADGRTIYTNAPLAGGQEVPVRSEVR